MFFTVKIIIFDELKAQDSLQSLSLQKTELPLHAVTALETPEPASCVKGSQSLSANYVKYLVRVDCLCSNERSITERSLKPAIARVRDD